eukprot:RCo038657
MYSLPQDLAALREYVTAPSSGIQARSATTVVLHVTHSNLRRDFPEIRMDRHMTIAAVKEKLHSATGTSREAMSLTLMDESGTPKASLNDDTKLLGYYSPEDGDVLHVVDLDPHSASAAGWLDDTSLVKKYEMPD